MPEHFYKDIINSSPFGFAFHELITTENGRPVDYRFINVNKAFGHLTGLDIETIVGKKVTEVLPGIENTEFNWIKLYGDVALNKSSKAFEQYSELLDRWYKVYAYSHERGFFSTMFVDITDQKNELIDRIETEKSLQESEAKYRKLIENLNDIVYQTDASMNITFVSKNIKKISGYKADEVIGRRFTDFVHSEDLKDRTEQFQKVKSNSYHPVEYRYLTKSGKVLWARTLARPIIKDGKFSGIQGVLTDITNLKETEHELRRVNRQLEKSSREKDKFFSIIAHDLRTPFSSIIGFSELLMDQVSNKEFDGIEEYAKLILKSSKKSMDLLTNLMTWARSKTGRMEFNPGETDLFELASENLKLFEESASQKSIKLSLEVKPGMMVMADTFMMSTVFRNLIGNAIKFTHPDGTVKVASKKDGDFIIVEICDNGIGMNSNIIKDLFRLDKDTGRPGTMGESSTGLGLVICKELVERNGGKIWAESREKYGSTFYFTLPSK